MHIVDIPNLPTAKVKVVLISECAGQDVLQNLADDGIEPLVVPSCKFIAPPVSAHPDMLFHHLGGSNMVCCYGTDKAVCKRLKDLGFQLIMSDSKLNPNYPYDIALNSARIGNFLFCNKKYTDKVIIDYCIKNGIKIVPVKQGYAKCSVLVVDSNSAITYDKSIAEAAKKHGIDVLLIRPGFIKLPGYNTGFIGGCGGKLSKNELYFCGSITEHPDYNEIKLFLKARGIEIKILGKGPLLDIGSIIPLLQE